MLGISRASEERRKITLLVMPRQRVEEMVRQAVECVEGKRKASRTATVKFRFSPTLTANRVAGRVAVAVGPGPPTVLNVEAETAIENLVV